MTESITMLSAESESTALTRFNALKHGLLSRYTVLPWEDTHEYGALLGALAVEHAPEGPTEEHLVEELAGILWRKRRLRLAEASAYRRGLDGTFESYHGTVKAALAHLGIGDQSDRVADAIRSTAADTTAEIAQVTASEAQVRHALRLLAAGEPGVYEAALASLQHEIQMWWTETHFSDPDAFDEGEEPVRADASGLRRFLEEEVLPWLETRTTELSNRPLIREQAFGEALDPEKLERLGRYEVHLDRKLERTLAMLLRLKDLRRTVAPT